jgi:WXG100 family type VII secretion target
METEEIMRIGASMEAMAQLKSQFDRQAQNVQTLASDLDGQVNMIASGEWEGPAANRFRDAWSSQFKPALQNLQQSLTEAGAEVENRRAALEQAGG